MSDASWESSKVAEERRKGAEDRSRYMADVTARMFDDAALAPGMRVLELGAGTGEMAAQLADRVGPDGHVVATDASRAMVEVARDTLKARANVTVEVGDALAIPMQPSSFDAAVARNLLMFLDLDVALPAVHRVLRPGARFAAAVWGPAAHNPFHTLVLDAARAEGGWGSARMDLSQAFSRDDRSLYETAFVRAGLHNLHVQVVGIARRFATVADALAKARESAIHSAPIDALPAARRDAAWKRVETGYARYEINGALAIPMEWVVVSGARPHPPTTLTSSGAAGIRVDSPGA